MLGDGSRGVEAHPRPGRGGRRCGRGRRPVRPRGLLAVAAFAALAAFSSRLSRGRPRATGTARAPGRWLRDEGGGACRGDVGRPRAQDASGAAGSLLGNEGSNAGGGGVARMAQLGQLQQRASFAERRQLGVEGDVVDGVPEARTKAAEEVEDEGRLRNGVADVAESVGEHLDVLGLVGDGELALHERVELLVEVDSPSLAVAAKLALDGSPES